VPAFPILGGRSFCVWRGLLDVTAGRARAKKRGRGRSRGPRGFLKSGVESSCGTLIEFVRSVHLGSVTKLGESALPEGCPGRRDLGRLRGNGQNRPRLRRLQSQIGEEP
jgi:hypothetical protein